VETVTEAVVVAVFVVISHITLVLATGCVDSSLAYANLFVEGDGFTVGVGLLSGVLARVGGVAFPLTGLSVVLFGVGSSALTEVSLGCVDAGVEVVLSLAVVSAILYVDLSFRVTLERLTVADEVRSLALGRVTLVPGKVHAPKEGGSSVEVRMAGEALLLRTTH
jgi:hypothetical protein